MSKIVRNEDAFTGLEAAIVLIAFVVVAAVFSYVVLGAGFFTTQKSQEVVHTGVAQASSSMEISGPVVIGADNANQVQNITFYLQLAAGGTSVDMSKVTYTVATNETIETFTNSTVWYTWYISGQENSAPDDWLLDEFEFVRVTLGENTTNVPTIRTNQEFDVEIRPDSGASYPLERNAPPYLSSGKYYEVY
ncbi:flagellin [Methanoculleus sp. FWC-SCC1]|uniref:Flagellin n=1 Tax=Methanoculleus frigidifontis TaxID=2584085 RepID=A0ABT8M622_9EURY|nr:archaellin/type IV pilin N-terminal domain-containing protein [Methanoculleus sp. FWC-SCC1]MDN7023378.1 flagellin [Methanoculleus sp. FWC-SCC1]